MTEKSMDEINKVLEGVTKFYNKLEQNKPEEPMGPMPTKSNSAETRAYLDMLAAVLHESKDSKTALKEELRK